MNLLAKYCKFGKPDALKNDSLASLVHGFRILYEESGHTESWSNRDNPLIGNGDISKLRRTRRIYRAHLDTISNTARALTAAIVCDHAAKLWYRGNNEGILLHPIFVVGLNLGLRNG